MNDPQRKADPSAAGAESQADASKPRKAYRTPECRDLGDMKTVTLKTGTSSDNQVHPTRP